ncbi:MAG: class I SAM-dependent methyltransferase [Candidatus Omnitrophica bacterium]|nr:class I SAM-dependent methyltransferase [Candidatus Omnitrophota bacterium]
MGKFIPEQIKSQRVENILNLILDLDIRQQVYDFWFKACVGYIDSVVELSEKIDKKEISSAEAEKTFFQLTDYIMNEARTIENKVEQKIAINKIKDVFRELVGGLIYRGVIVKRGFEKPRGYPGDYKVIEEVYDNSPLSTEIGYYSDKYFLNNEYAVAVRNRKDKMREILFSFLVKENNKPVRILNLACGSCREIKEVFADKSLKVKNRLIFSLLDQDEEALDFARNSLKDFTHNVTFDFLKDDVLSLARKKEHKEGLSDFDLVYSIGLADYLPDRLLKSFVRFCIEALKPAGKFIIAHKDIEICKPTPPAWFCDWNFYGRNEKALRDLIVSSGAGKFKIEKTIREKSNRIFFLTVTKE